MAVAAATPAPTTRPLKSPGNCWPDHLNTLIVIHDDYDLHRCLQLSGPGMYQADFNVVVYPAVYELVLGRDYEIASMSKSFRQIHDL